MVVPVTNNTNNNQALLWSTSAAAGDVNMNNTHGVNSIYYINFNTHSSTALNLIYNGGFPDLLTTSDGSHYGAFYDTYFNKPGSYVQRLSGDGSALTVNQSYIAINSGDNAVTSFTMPALVPVGAFIEIAGNNEFGWSVQLQAGQELYLDEVVTSSGGSIASTNKYDCAKIVCTIANTQFMVCDSVGNLSLN